MSSGRMIPKELGLFWGAKIKNQEANAHTTNHLLIFSNHVLVAYYDEQNEHERLVMTHVHYHDTTVRRN